jgi:[protein-PII] uridylyltransferase
MISATLRDARAELLADTKRRGRDFAEALTALVDDALRSAFATVDAPPRDVALIALGSYGRAEMAPGSDVDVLLVHTLRGRRAEAVRQWTEALWYPLWDAGFVTGHGARTLKESLALADDDINAMTALLDIRHLAGDPDLTAELERKARELARKRQTRVLSALADAADLRRRRPGVIAEMLEPDVKEGAGGLRDVHALEWAGWILGDPGGVATLVERGYLTPADLARVRGGTELLLDMRVALHRVTGQRSDRLPLQEQDAVASLLDAGDADALVRELAGAAREIAWVAGDVWSRVRDAISGPRGREGSADHVVAEGVRRRDGRIHVDADLNGTVPALRLLEAGVAAAEHDERFDRASLARLRTARFPTWNVWERAAFVRLLRAGANAIPVFEALDHEGVLTRLLPEWERVRFLPQRNAYHRFTVDRHLLEAVAQCALLLDAGEDGEGFDAVVARACRRPELLLFGALLHDIAKGRDGDHSEVGARTAGEITRRMDLDSEGREIVEWLVRRHLLMADIATRRDLSEATVADNLAAECAGDPERLRLLYLLTVGDSIATGPAAWSPAKAALVKDLFEKAAAAIERGEASAVAGDRREMLVERIGAERADAFLGRLPESYLLAFDVDTMVGHEELLRAPAVRCEHADDGRIVVTVVADDRPGLLATLAGALTTCGLDVLDASLFGTTDGRALDVFHGVDPFERVGADSSAVADRIRAALAGDVDIPALVDERRRSYASRRDGDSDSRVEIDNDASEHDTVVEVHTADDVGLLFRLATLFTELGLDVRVAKAATLGSRVVDVFYVRDRNAHKLDDAAAVRRLHEALVARLAE